MSEYISLEDAKSIMGKNFIGPDELRNLRDLRLMIPDILPGIPFSREELSEKSSDYLLILGVDRFVDNSPVTIRNMVCIFGKDPDANEPCFYNQDWYEKEQFIDEKIECGWFLIRKEVYEDSRAVQPVELLKKSCFPSAIMCCYSFFVTWMITGFVLWKYDFVWCRDTDHNGDRIYVGKYTDVDGVNKNGFSIHRHLSLRPCYGSIDYNF